MSEKVIATLAPTPARRVIAVAAIGGIGAVVLWMAATYPAPSAAILVGLVGLAVLCFAAAAYVWRVSAVRLELTEHELRDTAGRQLFALADVDQIEKGMLAWKPAGGFAVVLKSRKGRIWVPGVWWRLGRRVMIGGATNSGEAKAMADLMAEALNRNDSNW